MDTTLVTGATGLVGYNVVLALLRRGRSVRALVRSIDRGRALLPEACELVQGDIADATAADRARLADLPAVAGPPLQREGAARAGLAADPPAPRHRPDPRVPESGLTGAGPRRDGSVRT
jgi:uncharacterized protein YbjT (DUF2867 family)